MQFGLLFYQTALWLGFHIDGKTFTIAPMLEDQANFKLIEIPNPSSRFIMLEEVQLSPNDLKIISNNNNSITPSSSEQQQQKFEILLQHFNEYYKQHEQEFMNCLIDIWEQDHCSNTTLSFSEILHKFLPLSPHNEHYSELDKAIRKFVLYCCINSLSNYEKIKHKEITFRLVSADELLENRLKMKFKHQMELFSKEVFHVELNDEESIILKTRLLDCLIFQSHSIYWNDICKYPSKAKSLEARIRKWLDLLGTKLSFPEALILKSNVFPKHLVPTLIKCILNQIDKKVLHTMMEDQSQFLEYKDLVKNWDINTSSWKFYDNVITIDSEGTMDIDDAISIESYETNSMRVAIHITNVAHFFYSYLGNNSLQDMLKDPIFKEAARKVTSYYDSLPRSSVLFRNPDELDQDARHLTVFPMLYPSLSENILSLKTGKRLTMTYEFEFNDFDSQPKLLGIYPSCVNIIENTTYEQAEALFEKDEKWNKLFSYCRALYERRIQNGAPSFENRKCLTPEPSNNTTARLSISERRGLKSSLVISESAVLIGSIVGEYFKAHNIPGITRNFDSRKKISLTSVCNKDTPSPYLQQTSPVRRFIDLLNQLQLYLFLTQQTMLSVKQLEEHCDRIESESTKAQEVEDHIIMYWFLCYLWEHYGPSSSKSSTVDERNCKALKGTVGRFVSAFTKIILNDEQFCSFSIHCANLHYLLGGKYCVEGLPINFVIESIDWELLTVSIRVVEEGEQHEQL
ncbi:hypothetical protein C9374_014603 [Naegleria lovaniensis]|uniref:RNB domain-containing protein n=1 Tax=Naegleria lovaniensis TaxID=51637 RepID=A0AA88H193_NAELO|nr:uncharacterized protein C9374_014603 [Naegleria lovaniensis]KAG2389203.1 hypothetical protein C9374_014603 [Naegleria lovaniensis]